MKSLHPAVFLLLWCKYKAAFRKCKRAFSSRRRILYSTIGILLALVYLSQVILSILLRESLDPQRFRESVPLGLTVYTLWHLVRTAFKRPEVPIAWTPAEIEQLSGAPFSRLDLLAYRFGAILNAALIKAFCFSLLMLPDLTIWLAGFVGAFLALFFVDLWRVWIEIVMWGYHRPCVQICAQRHDRDCLGFFGQYVGHRVYFANDLGQWIAAGDSQHYQAYSVSGDRLT